MKLFSQLWKHAPLAIVLAVALGLAAGGVNTVLIAMIQHATRSEAFWGFHSRVDIALLFAFCAGCQIILSYSSSVVIALIPNSFLRDFRVGLVRGLLYVPLSTIESFRNGNIHSRLTDEVGIVGLGASAIPHALLNACIVIGGMLYIASLSPAAVVIVLTTMAISVVFYSLFSRQQQIQTQAFMTTSRTVHSAFSALVGGAKELRTNTRRREVFLQQHLTIPLADVKRFSDGNVHHLSRLVAMVGTLSWAAIGAVLFSSPAFVTKGTADVTIFVLFLIGPFAVLVDKIAVVKRGSAVLESLQALEQTVRIPLVSDAASAPLQLCEHIQLRAVEHRYRGESVASEFKLGPIDLELRCGEILFLVGGNGSGKSTLAKLIVGLYEPERGTILLDGIAITEPAQRQAYAQLFSTVFADYYLFDWVPDAAGLDDLAKKLLVDFRLDHAVSFEAGRFSTTSLSSGQRRRLALVVAYLEDRPIYVFDEWAADQDPVFKRVFYEEVLPALKARGKTCLVISHDERYFHVGDRVVHIVSGKIVASKDQWAL